MTCFTIRLLVVGVVCTLVPCVACVSGHAQAGTLTAVLSSVIMYSITNQSATSLAA